MTAVWGVCVQNMLHPPKGKTAATTTPEGHRECGVINRMEGSRIILSYRDAACTHGVHILALPCGRTACTSKPSPAADPDCFLQADAVIVYSLGRFFSFMSTTATVFQYYA